MRLSKNFYLSEFTKLSDSQVTPVQKFLLKALCNDILEPLRAFFSCPINVTSGMRTRDDYNRLKARGYHPSETSDHFFGEAVPLTRKSKIQKFGNFYSYSVGAADIVPACGADVAFDRLKDYISPIAGWVSFPQVNLRVGQLILEHGKSYWLHVSNPATLVYSRQFAKEYLKRIHFLKSLDNGKTYQPIT